MLAWQGSLPLVAAAAGVAFCVVSLAWFLPQRHQLTELELAPVM